MNGRKVTGMSVVILVFGILWFRASTLWFFHLF